MSKFKIFKLQIKKRYMTFIIAYVFRKYLISNYGNHYWEPKMHLRCRMNSIANAGVQSDPIHLEEDVILLRKIDWFRAS